MSSLPFYWSRAEREQAERNQRWKDEKAAEEYQFERTCSHFFQLNPAVQFFLDRQREAGNTPRWREGSFRHSYPPVASAGNRYLDRLGWSITGRFEVNTHTSNLTLFPDGDWKLTYCGLTFCIGATSGEMFYAGKLEYNNEPADPADVVKHGRGLLESLTRSLS